MATDSYPIFAIKAPNWLGDCVLSIPAIRAVAEHSLSSRVMVLASVLSSQIIRRLPNTMVFGYHKQGGSIGDSIYSIAMGVSRLIRLKPIIAMNFTRSASGAIMFYLARITRRVGFANTPMAYLYTDKVSQPDRRTHLVDFYCRLPESIGIKVTDRLPSLKPTDEETDSAMRLLAGHGIEGRDYVCLFPGSSYGPSKRWSYDRFGLLADRLADRFGLVPVIIGSRADLEACEAVVIRTKTKAINLCGKADLGTVMGLVSMARATVANDSGGMHLAAAVGTPVVGLFFSTQPSWTGPLSPKSKSIYKPLECSPCFRRNCQKGNLCTQTISVDDVLSAIEELIE